MTMTKAPRTLVLFDVAKYLVDAAAVAQYMTAVMEANDPDYLLVALRDIARVKGQRN